MLETGSAPNMTRERRAVCHQRPPSLDRTIPQPAARTCSRSSPSTASPHDHSLGRVQPLAAIRAEVDATVDISRDDPGRRQRKSSDRGADHEGHRAESLATVTRAVQPRASKADVDRGVIRSEGGDVFVRQTARVQPPPGLAPVGTQRKQAVSSCDDRPSDLAEAGDGFLVQTRRRP